MIEFARIGLFLGMIVAGWSASRKFHETARTIARRAGLCCACVLGVVIATGVMRASSPWIMPHHRWAVLAFQMVSWFGVPWSVGIVLERRLRSRPVAAIVQCWVLVSVLVVGWSAAVTGYLGPTNNFEIDEETRNRFVVMHLFFLPAVMAGLLLAWWRYFRVRRERPVPDEPALDELTVVEG